MQSVSADKEELEGKVEALTEEEASVEEKVAESLNEIGVEAVSLEAEGSARNYAEEFTQINDPVEKTKFYREHKEHLLGGIN